MKTKILLLFCVCLSVFSCEKEYRAQKMSAEINAYIYAYTSGTVDQNESILVRFTSPRVASELIGSEVDPKFYNIKPSIDGAAIWQDNHTIKFTPAEKYKGGINYVFRTQLDALFEGVPPEARMFEFDIRTLLKTMDVATYSLKNLSAKKETHFLEGQVRLNQDTEPGNVEKVLSAKQDGKDLDVRWYLDNSRRIFKFKIEGISRGDTNSEVSLYWDGEAAGVDAKDSKVINVPPFGAFELLQAYANQENSDQTIILNFSDPVKRQDFTGLVRVVGYTGGFRFMPDGNNLRVTPKRRITGEHVIKVSKGIVNVYDKKLTENWEQAISFQALKPQLRLVGDGVIVPESEGLIFPFEAVNLNGVIVEIFKIYDTNILQFLQTNDLDGQHDLKRVGKIVHQEKIDLLAVNPEGSTSNWTQYAIDLKSMIDEDPQAIYQIRLGFYPDQIEYECTSNDNQENLTLVENLKKEDGKYNSIFKNYHGVMGRYEGFRWSDRDNPCKPAYCNYENFVRKNVLMSNLGLIAKEGNDKAMYVHVTDLRTAEALGEVQLNFYNYQQQLIRSVLSDVNGNAVLKMDEEAYLVVAESAGEKGYLKLMDGNTISLSRFDVSGSIAQKGLKGFIYGERGVWRPGDSLYLNFVIEDEANPLPKNHPLTFELYDPKSQLQTTFVTTKRVGNVYGLPIATSPEAITGNWRASVKIGGAKFSKTLKIETIKPNRLKLDLDFGSDRLSAANKNLKGKLQVNWLHGAPAKNLKSIVEVEMKSMKTSFDTYKEFVFDDPARIMNAEPQKIFEGEVDHTGATSFSPEINIAARAPGQMKAQFKVRAFEKGGDFSTDNFSMIYDAYDAYTGIYLPEDKSGNKEFQKNAPNQIDFVVVDKEGKAVPNRNLEVGIYRVNWRWWWDRNEDNVSRYNSGTHVGAVETMEVTTNIGGEANWSFEPKSWGRYLVRVCDTESGHCSGDFFYSGYPDKDSNRNAAAMLSFTADKESYEIGDKVSLTIPSSEAGRCLISLENGTGVLRAFWEDLSKGDNKIVFDASEDMAPNVYAHVTLIQPHAQTENDLPIRMYGVIPLKVENPKSALEPVLNMQDQLAPQKEVSIQVSEKQGRPMTYTIAVVDDGLLDLTRFKTPNPWDAFFAREALGVKTWDIYDRVLGAFGGKMERVLSIGGDGEIVHPDGKKKANRFKPVVQHFGPFYLESGSTTHTFEMPNYVGSVRTMIVASGKNAYGCAEKTTPVKKPLMILATLPRVLGPNETLKLPVNVFAMEEKVKQVSVSIEESSGLVEIVGEKTKTINFPVPGDEIVDFDLKVSESVGIAHFTIRAEGGGEVTTQEIEIDIRNPNPMVTDIYKKDLAIGENWEQSINQIGVLGTNNAVLEVSNIPPINLGERLEYLIRYPHGCIEQTTSSGFPQLYVDRLIELDDKQKKEVPENIKGTIDRLKMFYLNDGSFTYWPGEEYSIWGTNYAGHFLLECKNAGYQVPDYMMTNWVKFQTKQAKHWSPNSDNNEYYRYGRNDYLMQAYRLYGLALAGSPEMGSMNRLREQTNLDKLSKWRLAAAYALAGKPEVARELIQAGQPVLAAYRELSNTYGSDLRDDAMLLETLTILKDGNAAGEKATTISNHLSADKWYGTHSVAYGLLAIGKYAGLNDGNVNFNFAYDFGNGSPKNIASSTPFYQVSLPIETANSKKVVVQNTTGATLFCRVIAMGQPLIGDQTASASKIKMEVVYRDMGENVINPNAIPQGTDFMAEVKIQHDGGKYNFENMALTQIFPSGWEIQNSRMDGITGHSDGNHADYQDIRDDRVYTYFNLKKEETHVYKIQLNAAYKGRYYLSTTFCEAMYDVDINARQPGMWVEVVAPEAVVAAGE